MTLDQQLLAAHANDDRRALVALYTQAADQADDTDAACFYLTQAYVFALDTADGATNIIRARLARFGRV